MDTSLEYSLGVSRIEDVRSDVVEGAASDDVSRRAAKRLERRNMTQEEQKDGR